VAILVLSIGVLGIGRSAQKYEATSTILITPRAERFQLASESVLRVILPNVELLAESQSLQKQATPTVPAEFTTIPISVTASLDTTDSSLFLNVDSKDANTATAWSGALARTLVERMKNDPYLGIQLLDPAQGAVPTGRRVKIVSFVALFAFAIFAFVLVAFGAQRLEEARDVVGALRRRGVRVLGAVGASRRRGGRDGLQAIVAVLLSDDYDDGDVVVTAMNDPSLAEWLVDRLDREEERFVVEESPGVGILPGIGAVAGPPVGELCLRASSEDLAACVLAVDERASSVTEIVASVKLMQQAGVACRGVVLIRGSHTLHESSDARAAAIA
jgi:hypothetical protein